LLREHEADTIPGDRMLGFCCQDLPIRLKRQLVPAGTAEQQRQIEARLGERRLGL
jgi:hypothetical protein